MSYVVPDRLPDGWAYRKLFMAYDSPYAVYVGDGKYRVRDGDKVLREFDTHVDASAFYDQLESERRYQLLLEALGAKA